MNNCLFTDGHCIFLVLFPYVIIYICLLYPLTIYAVQYDNCESFPTFISAINGCFQVFLYQIYGLSQHTNTVIIPSFVIVDSPPSLPKKYAIMCLAARQDSAQRYIYIVWPEYNVSLHKLSFLQELVLMYVTQLSMGISYSTFECCF